MQKDDSVEGCQTNPHRIGLPMKIIFCLFAICSHLSLVSADTLVLFNDHSVNGTVIQTNADELVLLTDFGTFNFPTGGVKQIKFDQPEVPATTGRNRFPDFKALALRLSKESWAAPLKQIPATVIDKGMLRNVPYLSFKCGDDYEVNVYGDLKDPVAIEAGVYRKLLTNEEAKRNCLRFMAENLAEPGDREVVQGLNLEKDLKSRNGCAFEITPPGAEDAYGGWWISAYFEDKLNLSRASAEELRMISQAKGDAQTNGNKADASSTWTGEEMKLARPSLPDTVTIVNSQGETITNAQVVRVVDGAYLIWRQGAGGGRIKLSDLPEDLRVRFGYDSSKAEVAYSAEDRRKALAAQAQVPTAAPAQTPKPQADSYDTSYPVAASSASSGGRVYVRGYYRSNGTYVAPYSRSYPHRR